MTRTDATTDNVDMHITQRKYREIIGTALELGGKISESTRLNMTTDSRMVISKKDNAYINYCCSLIIVASICFLT